MWLLYYETKKHNSKKTDLIQGLLFTQELSESSKIMTNQWYMEVDTEMRNFFRRIKGKQKSKLPTDKGSEISVSRTTGGYHSDKSKSIDITMKSKTETIDSLLKKIQGVI